MSELHMTGPKEAFEVANAAADAAAKAALMARGLAELIDEFRLADDEVDPIPAPGLEGLRDAALAAFADAVDRFGAVENLVEPADDSSAEGDERTTAVAALTVAAEAGVAVADLANTRVRQLAQLGLGVAAHGAWTDATARLERAAISAITATPGDLAHDGLHLVARDRDGLRCELAGAITRLLIEWGGTFTVELPGDARAGLRFEVEGDTLLGWAHGADTTALLEAEWPEGDGDGAARGVWPSPVTIMEPATLAVRTLYDVFGLERVEDLVVSVTSGRTIDPLGRPRPSVS